jgi:hypothetical protein
LRLPSRIRKNLTSASHFSPAGTGGMPCSWWRPFLAGRLNLVGLLLVVSVAGELVIVFPRGEQRARTRQGAAHCCRPFRHSFNKPPTVRLIES